ncbi:hypothetical protein ACT426_05135 [Acinetobacter baumannii]|uniref:hypothetical protein n=1 Tax=Acinetobacter baumannii TaxID=470 RepID=UPI0008105B0C|nr:hypothetical protein [Acinetobacter baumannii]MDC4786620.1 hypothetical protein [Acinetobacter baumannii]MDV7233280.1 hypothetical protein [Acinetobacter baumannii]
MSYVDTLYYDLKEATEILSKNLTISNLSPKKLIKYIAQFQIPMHIYGFGFSMTGDFDSLTMYSKSRSSFLTDVESELSGWNTETGSLFQISDDFVKLFQFHDTLPISEFQDVIPIATLQYANNASDSLKLTMASFKYYGEGFKVLALYPYISANNYNKEELSQGFINGIKIKPRFIADEMYDISDSFFDICLNIEKFIVNFDDLLLLRNNLYHLESYLSGKEEYSPSFVENKKNITRQKNNRGVSQKKINAKLTAKAFAEYFWKQDKNNEIKIRQMCEKVYFSLFETEYKDQLPEQFISIKSWIKDIAPKYASEAGRNKE